MPAASTAKVTPSFAAIDDMSWNRLNELAYTSKNRQLLARIVHAENACIADAPSSRIRDNRIVATVVARAIRQGWSDVLESAVSSRHVTLQDHANILRCGKVFTEAVYLGILNSPAAESPTILGMLRYAPYASVKEGVEVKRTAIVVEAIEAARMDPESYASEDGYEHEDICQAVTIALALHRHDLLAELVATGCAGDLTAARKAMGGITLPQAA